MDQNISDPTIVIIGAGISGLAAGIKLYESGFNNILILESKNRIGGRISTVTLGGIIFDEGATYAHGIEGDVIQKLIRDAKETVIEWDYCDKVRNGKWLLDPGRMSLIDSDWKSLVKVLADAFASHHEIVDWKAGAKMKLEAMTQLEHFNLKMEAIKLELERKFKELNLSNDDIEWLVGSLVRFCKLREQVDSGSHVLSDSPAWQLSVYFQPPGADAIFKNGCHKLLDPLIKRLPSRCIRLNQKVKKIQWNRGNLRQGLNTSIGNKPVTVVYESGGKVEFAAADHVIATISVGCLKEGHMGLFHPQLPLWKVKSIESFNNSKVEKIVLIYEEPFWGAGVDTIILLWDISKTDPSFCGWVKGIVLFNVFEDEKSSKYFLESWITGENAVKIASISRDDVGRECTKAFSYFFRRPVPMPKFVHKSNWISDPFTRGSYSYPNLQSNPGVFEDLERPISSDNGSSPFQLLFAGEATIKEYFGTVHGAYLSGEREGQRLVDFYNSQRGAQA